MEAGIAFLGISHVAFPRAFPGMLPLAFSFYKIQFNFLLNKLQINHNKRESRGDTFR
jgi:hypothetical protein